MGGLQRLLLRITPIFMLICFICFGITHTFQQTGQANITYLTHETVNVGTQENPNNIEVYNFDTSSYIQNINQDIIKRSTQNVIDIQTYANTIDTFNAIWENGYDFGDGVKTIINAIILVINSILTPINIFLTPLRIIAGILLTLFSLVGININRQTPIINTLNGILDNGTIPLLKPTYNKNEPAEYYGTTWYYSDPSFGTSRMTSITLDYHFTSQAGGNYKKVAIYKRTGVNNYEVVYTDQDGYEITVYTKNSGWIYTDSRTITIASDNTLEATEFTKLTTILRVFDAIEVQ